MEQGREYTWGQGGGLGNKEENTKLQEEEDLRGSAVAAKGKQLAHLWLLLGTMKWPVRVECWRKPGPQPPFSPSLLRG